MLSSRSPQASKNPPHTAVHPSKYELSGTGHSEDTELTVGGGLCGYLSRVAQAESVPDFVLGNPWLAEAAKDDGPHSDAEDL